MPWIVTHRNLLWFDWVHQFGFLLETEMDHANRSSYSFRDGGTGSVQNNDIGLVWGYALPSDDRALLPYNIPQNLFLAWAIKHFVSVWRAVVWADKRADKNSVVSVTHHFHISCKLNGKYR